MYKWGIGAAAAALAVPFATGQADAQNSYISGAVTWADLDSADTTILNRLGPGSHLIAVADAETGFGGRTAIGTDLGSVRIEGELGIARNDFEKYRTRTPSLMTLPLSGKVKLTSVMVNALMDFDVAGAGFVPYLGVGVGGANVDIEAVGALPTAPAGPQIRLIDDDETDLAWQAMAGISIPLGDRFALTLQYRYFHAGTVDGTDTTGRAYHADITSGNVDIGIRISF